jgi:hypothetical protein
VLRAIGRWPQSEVVVVTGTSIETAKEAVARRDDYRSAGRARDGDQATTGA